MTLHEAQTPRRCTVGYDLDIRPGWAQGRGAFGGLVIGSLIRAIEDRVSDATRAVRNVTAQLAGPAVVGPSRISVDVLRAGSSVTTARASLEQAGEIKAHAVAILARGREASTAAMTWRELVAPDVPDWSQVPAAPEPGLPSAAPEFARRFEWRMLEGVPFSGPAAAARALGWIRAREPGDGRDAAYLAAMIDAWFPIALVRLAAPRPVATIAYTLDVVASPDDLAKLDLDVPLLYRATAPVCRDGYCVEARELWSPDRQLIALNQQTFVVIA